MSSAWSLKAIFLLSLFKLTSRLKLLTTAPGETKAQKAADAAARKALAEQKAAEAKAAAGRDSGSSLSLGEVNALFSCGAAHGCTEGDIGVEGDEDALQLILFFDSRCRQGDSSEARRKRSELGQKPARPVPRNHLHPKCS